MATNEGGRRGQGVQRLDGAAQYAKQQVGSEQSLLTCFVSVLSICPATGLSGVDEVCHTCPAPADKVKHVTVMLLTARGSSIQSMVSAGSR